MGKLFGARKSGVGVFNDAEVIVAGAGNELIRDIFARGSVFVVALSSCCCCWNFIIDSAKN